MRSGLLFSKNHKQYREENQRNAESDIEREGFVKDQCTDDDGRQWLKNTKDGGLGGTHRFA